MKNFKDTGPFLPVDIDWTALAALSEFIKFDPAGRSLTIEIGKSSATLCEDGTIKLTGKRLIQDVSEDIHLLAGRIELN
ncbi:hypothetical protein [Rhizobium sp. ZPR3]|uniref:Sporulation protein n=2 Tax=unclassified Rhizobium TaxID=2613769 RepID=A0AAU7SQZ5_9HYPH